MRLLLLLACFLLSSCAVNTFRDRTHDLREDFDKLQKDVDRISIKFRRKWDEIKESRKLRNLTDADNKQIDQLVQEQTEWIGRLNKSINALDAISKDWIEAEKADAGKEKQDELTGKLDAWRLQNQSIIKELDLISANAKKIDAILKNAPEKKN